MLKQKKTQGLGEDKSTTSKASRGVETKKNTRIERRQVNNESDTMTNINIIIPLLKLLFNTLAMVPQCRIKEVDALIVVNVGLIVLKITVV